MKLQKMCQGRPEDEKPDIRDTPRQLLRGERYAVQPCRSRYSGVIEGGWRGLSPRAKRQNQVLALPRISAYTGIRNKWGKIRQAVRKMFPSPEGRGHFLPSRVERAGFVKLPVYRCGASRQRRVRLLLRLSAVVAGCAPGQAGRAERCGKGQPAAEPLKRSAAGCFQCDSDPTFDIHVGSLPEG